MPIKLTTAIVGAGNWGSNLLRNLSCNERVDLRWVCDQNENTLKKHLKTYPGLLTTTRMEDALFNEEVQAVVVATPVESHYKCAFKALDAGKHVFVEKPLTTNSRQAAKLVAMADHRQLKLMVGHLMRHNGVVEYIKRLMDAGEFGDTRYMYSQRVNLGIVRSHENAWWSLAPHDISVACYLFDAVPEKVSATGQCFINKGVEDVVFATLHYGDGRIAHIHVSWLDPHKTRKMTIVGTEKMADFDDMEATEKLRIYDKGVRLPQTFTTFAEAIQIRTGDILIPKIDLTEPLGRECRRFVNAVLDNEPLYSDGRDGLNVVRILEAGEKSLLNGGIPVDVAPSMPTVTPAAAPTVVQV